MTSPTPPPGWHPDPVDPNIVRYWDGTQWTGDTQPKAAQNPTPQKKGGVGKVPLVVAGVLVVMGILGTVFGGNDKKDDKPAAAATTSATTTTTAVPTTSKPAASTSAPAAAPPATQVTAAAPPATTTQVSAASPRPAVPVSDPRCAPANESLVDMVESGFSASGLSLINGMVIGSGPYTFLGGTTVDSTGKVKNRSDVWVISNGAVYASTGGARNTTTWPKASAAPLQISPGDEIVQALDTCVVNMTR
ncbi:hypothetical protein WSS_A40035 [Rhodococcus opacus M213]|uniref:DUF2510 domain-containing protein n=1 Tax=Rhodococcus opacus M213 TaxID=1129896 RepID=K8X835_RHOOP|nr:DUF2510 domain-containing protein [Rhodococcus opacus]EKT76961.1 hypothetical protein WSS_A40035 [Rhodococcus opacus M213]